MADASNKYRIIVWRKAYDRRSSVISRDILHMEEAFMSSAELGEKIKDCVNRFRPRVTSLEDLDIQVVTLVHRSRQWQKNLS